MRAHRLLLVLAVACVDGAGATSGQVFVDRDGDGVLSPGDTPLAGVGVFWETRLVAVTDADGYFDAVLPGPGIVWIGTTDAVAPGPSWRAVTGDEDGLDFALTSAAQVGPVVFAVASDTHTGLDRLDPGALQDAFEQIATVEPDASFLVITGDLTQSNEPQQFAELAAAIDDLPVPFVPVPGNHDWYDGGETYRAYFGPPSYTFSSGGAHFLVLNDADTLEARAELLMADRILRPDGAPVIAFMHAPPEPELVALLRDAGVDYLFSGHMHANRVLAHEGFVELNTQPLVMGGMDQSPGGFRIAWLDGDSLRIAHHTTTRAPVARIVSATAPAGGCEVPILAAVEGVRPRARITMRMGDREVDLEPRGGWTWAGMLSTCDAPGNTAELWVRDGGDAWLADTVTLATTGCDPDPQPQAPTGTGRVQWQLELGGHLQGGAPVIDGDLAFVAVDDYADGSRGAVVAVDLLSRTIRWRHTVGQAVRNAPAVVADVVVFVGNDGVVHAVERDTGALRWQYQLAEWLTDDPRRRSGYAAPVIDGGVVYVGVQRELVALDAATGARLWSAVPSAIGGEASTYAAVTVAGDLVIATFARGTNGLQAFDAATGVERWRTDARVTVGAQGTPIVDEARRRVYVVNWLAEVHAVDLDTGAIVWGQALVPDAFEWAFASQASPAFDGDTLYVPTTFGDLRALPVEARLERWRVTADQAYIHATHYDSYGAGFTTAPILHDGLVVVAAPDGLVRALAPETGDTVWSHDLGIPILMAPAPYGDRLIVGSYDGVLHVLADPAAAALAACPPPPPRADHGCSSGPRQAPGFLLLFALAAARGWPRRRRSR